MPLYEMFCIAVHNQRSPTNLRQLVDTLTNTVHRSGGVVRKIQNLGLGLTLPERMRAHQQYHTHGDHFALHFDVSPLVLRTINETMRRDPMVIRWTILKKGEKVADLGILNETSIRSVPVPRDELVYQAPFRYRRS
ncbi:ribosomal protein S6 [Tremella mesenterica]|uniref:Ribosomal protein S6 n=1 Tax=Tremella mesenterica TaxID=5217 RepID=A0A4Q1BT07_TREME|nr:ribosomal protein S6 [Tremella mesenterica]